MAILSAVGDEKQPNLCCHVPSDHPHQAKILSLGRTRLDGAAEAGTSSCAEHQSSSAAAIHFSFEK